MNKSIEFLNAVDGVWKKPVPADVMARLGGRLYVDSAHTMFVGEIVDVR